MIAEKLRKAILQAAMQGKLTQQLPEDGDARDLLTEIQQEKKRKIKTGEIKATKLLPPIDPEEIPYEIPENWVWTRLGEIGELNPRNQLDDDLMVGFLPMKAIDPGYGNTCSPKLKKWKTIKNGYTHFKDDDLLIAKITPCFQNRKSVVVNSLPNGYGAGSTEFHVLRFHNLFIDNRFMLNVVKSARFIDEGVNSMTGTAGQQRVGVSYISNFLIALPPFAEQKRIVNCINSLMLIIEELGKNEEELDSLEQEFPEKLKKSLLQAAMQGKLTEQFPEDGDARGLLVEIQREKKRKIKAGEIKAAKPLPSIDPDEILYEIPENWVWTRIGEITNYGDTNQINKADIKQGSWILELEDIEKNTTRLISIRTDRIAGSSKLIFNAGDILYGKLRPYLRKVIVATKPGFCSGEIIPFKGYGDVNSHFLKYYMLSPYATLSINSQTFGTKMPRAGTDQVRTVQIPLPPLDEQQRIVSVLDKLLPLSEGLRQP